LWQGKTGVWCSIDIEAWEMDHRLITEFGWSTIHWEESTEVQGGGHLIVKEYETYRNGKYVADNQKVLMLLFFQHTENSPFPDSP
jgi:hypothetical protein